MNPSEPGDPKVVPPVETLPGGDASVDAMAGAGETTPPPEPPPTPAVVPAEPARPSSPDRRRAKALRESAQAFYARAQSDIYNILYNPNLENPPIEEGAQPEPIPDEELSYAVLVRENATAYYGFTYEEGSTPSGRRQKPKEKVAVQSPAAHAMARDKARELLQTFFAEQQDRVAKLQKRLEDKAKKMSKDNPEEYSRHIVRNTRDEGDKGGRLDYRIAGANKSLERLRLAALDDVLDWFRMRVNQVEGQIQAITRRTSATDKIEDRITRLENDPAIQEALAALDQDYQMIQEVTAHEPIAPQDKDKKFFKSRLENKTKAAGRIREFVNRSQQRLREVLNVNRQGRNQVEAQADRLIEGLVSGADLFMAEARRQMIGLSPEEERNFLEALNELFDDVGGVIEGKPDSTERRATIYERFKKANQTFHLFEKYQDGRVQRDRLVRAPEDQPVVVNEDHTPGNIDELFARAKQDAIVLGEIRQMMRRTFAIMGPKFATAARAELKGMPNADKKEAVTYMNDLLAETQKKVLKELMADEAFKTSLGERKVQELRFANAEDKPLIQQIRQKVFEVLKLGDDTDKPNLEVIPTLMEAPPDAETVEQEAEAAQEERRPVFQSWLKGEATPEVLTQVFPVSTEHPNVVTPAEFAKSLKDLLKEIRNLADASPVREVIVQSFDQVISPTTTDPAEVLKEAARKLRNVRDTFATLQRVFGKDWVSDAGLVVTDPSNPRQKQANEELITAALQRFAQVDDFIEALQLDTVPAVPEKLLTKVPPDVRSRLDRVEISPEQQLALLLVALPHVEGPKLPVDVHPFTALKRVANYLNLGQMRGPKLLLDRKFTKIDDEATGDWSYDLTVIMEVMSNKANDQQA